MDVSESIPTERKSFFLPKQGIKERRGAIIELVVDCCRITAGEEIGTEEEGGPAASSILIFFPWKMPSLTNG